MSFRRSASLPRAKNGQALILAIVFLAIIATASSAILGYVGAVAKSEKSAGENRFAAQIAQAGIEKAIWCLNQDNGANCGGSYGSTFSGETNVSSPPGVFSTNVTSLDSSTKEIVSTGFITNSINPAFTQTIRAKATITSANASFTFGLQVGNGGLEIGNATIEGSVYSNGTIDGDNGAAITGDAYVAGGSFAVPDQEWTITNSDFTLGQGTPQTDVAQSFVTSISGNINKLSFYIKKTGNPSNCTVRIVSDNNNKPSKTVLETGTLTASQVTTIYQWVDVSLDDPLSVDAGTKYWIIIDAANSSSNYWAWTHDEPGGYVSGKGMYSPDWNAGSPNWTDTGGDLDFKVWMAGIITEINNVDIGGNAHAHTIKNSTVGGDAFYQILNNTTVNGIEYPESTDPISTIFPISDGQIAEWKADAESGETIIGDFSPPDNEVVSLGPAKITGNLILDNGQTLILTGTIHVQGYVDIGNRVSVQLSPGYGFSSGMLISDGWMHFENNGAFQGAGSGSYLMFLTTAAGGSHHDSAMDLHNNVTGVLLYAPNGFINLHNNVNTTQITANKIKLANGSILTYNIGLTNINFSSGPGGSWKFLPGSWRIVK